MSLIIQNAKMPTSCYDCFAHADGRCNLTGKYSQDEIPRCCPLCELNENDVRICPDENYSSTIGREIHLYDRTLNIVRQSLESIFDKHTLEYAQGVANTLLEVIDSTDMELDKLRKEFTKGLLKSDENS